MRVSSVREKHPAPDLDASLIPIKMRAVWTDFSHHYLLGDLLVLVNGVDWGQFGFLIAEQLPHSLLIAIVGFLSTSLMDP